MRHNIKFHAFAISVIVAVITMLFFLIGPDISIPESEQASGDRYIQIYSATWGTNCNPYINMALKERDMKPFQERNKPPPKPQPSQTLAPTEQPIDTSHLKPASLNNVLSAVSDRCNGHIACDMEVTSEKLGVEPMASCFKRLLISYRCYDLDRLWNVDLGQGETLKINCRAGADEASGRTK